MCCSSTKSYSSTHSDSTLSRAASATGISSTEISKGREYDNVDVTPIPGTPAVTSNISGGLTMNIPVSQLPPLSMYSGNLDAETFEEWHGQFQLVAAVCKWDDRLKLANFATHLQG